MASPSPPKPWERGTPTGKSTRNADFSIPSAVPERVQIAKFRLCSPRIFTSQLIYTFLKSHLVRDTRNLHIRAPTPPFEALNPQFRRQPYRLKLHTIQQNRLWHLSLQ